ncbi:HAD family hydrolase [Desulfatiferula olefinivorans]
MIFLFDWGDTLMRVDPDETGPMYRWKNPRACPHAAETLSALSRRGLCCLATNARDSDERDIWKALARAGLDQGIHRVFCSRNLKLSKPDPAFFHAVCRSLACAPFDILMVGDDPVADYAWARDNGGRALLYDPAGIHGDKGCRTIRDLLELVDSDT